MKIESHAVKVLFALVIIVCLLLTPAVSQRSSTAGRIGRGGAIAAGGATGRVANGGSSSSSSSSTAFGWSYSIIVSYLVYVALQLHV